MNEEKQQLIDELKKNHEVILTMKYKKALSELNPVGNRRPIHNMRNGKQAPVPWVGGVYPYLDQWSSASTIRADQAAMHRLCFMCGEFCKDNYVYALYSGSGWDSSNTFLGVVMSTFGHPKCVLKATLYCPYLKKLKYPVSKTRYQKDRMTHDEFRQYVKEFENGRVSN